MNRKLLAGLAVAGVLAGGGGAAAAIGAAGTPASAGTVAVAASVSRVPAYGPLGSLVAKGTLTQAQAFAIHNALVKYWDEHRQDMRAQCDGVRPAVLAPGGGLETVLAQLVKDGTITQAQADTVTSAFTQWLQTHTGYQARLGPPSAR